LIIADIAVFFVTTAAIACLASAGPTVQVVDAGLATRLLRLLDHRLSRLTAHWEG
jgi:hypothetical protein